MFKLNETFSSKEIEMFHVEEWTKFVSDKVTIQLVERNPFEFAILWDGTTVAILSDDEAAIAIFNHYCLKAMKLYPLNSFCIIDLKSTQQSSTTEKYAQPFDTGYISVDN